MDVLDVEEEGVLSELEVEVPLLSLVDPVGAGITPESVVEVEPPPGMKPLSEIANRFFDPTEESLFDPQLAKIKGREMSRAQKNLFKLRVNRFILTSVAEQLPLADFILTLKSGRQLKGEGCQPIDSLVRLKPKRFFN